jgi:hypothetical protein
MNAVIAYTKNKQTDAQKAHEDCVLNPIINPMARIPDDGNCRTALLAATDIYPLTTDSNGNLLIRADVQKLGVDTNSVTYNNDGSWSPTTGDDGLVAVASIGRSFGVLTTDGCYRIVAYMIRLRYTGSELNRSGLFFGCHNYDSSHNAINLVAASISQMQDSPYFKVLDTIDGLEIIYVPTDKSHYEFTKSGSGQPDFRPYTITCGILGGQTSTQCVYLESSLIIEYIPPQSQWDQVETKIVAGKPDLRNIILPSSVVRPIGVY